MKYVLAVGFLLHCLSFRASTQCATQIVVSNTTPYKESFENNNGGWTSGGVNDDWAWGTPNKKEIKTAGDGSKCWITGSLTGNRYNDGEQSWLQSPCFNCTALQYPYISFKIFWESELDFDGIQLQYSENGGLSWLNSGGVNDPVDCLNKNWYNAGNVDYLRRFTGDGNGWCGNIQTSGPSNCRKGQGSGGWLVAGKTMPLLKGKSNIRFRFIFASGTQCNNFDGAAIDSFTISEAVNTIAYTYQCVDVTQINFSAIGCANNGVSWNFGDPNSGMANTSSQQNPTHLFSGPGEYTITLTAPGGNDRPNAIATTQFKVAIVDATVITPLQCPGDRNAVLQASIQPASLSTGFTYSWNSSPVQLTATATALPPGIYTVTATPPPDGCASTATATIADIQPFQILSQKGNDTCDNKLGFIKTNVSGGTAPYLYSWSNGAVGTDEINLLRNDDYTLTVVDDNGCITTFTEQIESINPINIFLGNDTVICPGDRIILTPGLAFNAYLWQDGSTNDSLFVQSAGDYNLTIEDALYGCIAKDTIKIEEDCGEIYFPSAFTPNGDNKNEFFGALGNLNALQNFSMKIYDRWGALVFESTNPFIKWNGLANKNTLPAGATAYTWYARFDYRTQKNIFRKGTILVLY